MGKISLGRVILGGIVAAFIWWVLEFLVHGVVLGAEWEAAMIALGRSAEQQRANMGNFMMIVTVWCVIAGTLGVWMYAAIRPRFGKGPKTAAIAGVALWAALYLEPSLVDRAMGLWPANLTILPAVTSLLESIIATLVGSWLYKEE